MNNCALVLITIPTAEQEELIQQQQLQELQLQETIENNSDNTKSTIHKILQKSNTVNILSEINDTKLLESQYGTFQNKKLQKHTNSLSPIPSVSGSRSVSITIENEVKLPTIENCKESKNIQEIYQQQHEIADEPNSGKISWDGIKDKIAPSLRRNSKKKKDQLFGLDIPATSSQELVLIEILKKLKIDNSTWTSTNKGKSYQVTFSIKYNERYELLLIKLNEWGIGDREGSTVSILNCTNFTTINDDSNLVDECDPNEELKAQKNSAWNRFMNSINARLNVAQIVNDVKKEATITFDFIILAVSAAILASFGLVEDSTIFLASSMLISPLMGPIIAGIFGTVIKDNSLRTLGLVNELLGILLATFVGFCFGLITCFIDDPYGIGKGVTAEMQARCEIHSVIVGIFTAIPSGAAAAVGILGGNIGSLVGVAISASLLPPAVNAGLLWALACVYTVYDADTITHPNMTKTNVYSDHQAIELGVYGLISMCVTITNIICVYVMGILVLKAKEVAPILSRNNMQFWKHDIKIARDYNKNCFVEDPVIANEIAAFHNNDHETLALRSDMLNSINIDNAAYQNTWSPMGARTFGYMENDSNIQDIDRLYMTVTRPIPVPKKYIRKNSMAHSTFSGNRTIENILKERRLDASRRASMPFDSRFPNHYSSANIRRDTLSSPSELLQSNNNESAANNLTSNFPNKNRKFIVTPVSPSFLK